VATSANPTLPRTAPSTAATASIAIVRARPFASGTNGAPQRVSSGSDELYGDERRGDEQCGNEKVIVSEA